LDWKGYSVHDAANVLRRFLNYLPEPVIVHQLYQPFRDVILATNTEAEKVVLFQNLIEQLPEHHQYLLFYLLDLLSLSSQNVQITKMDTFNLASVFTPGILLNPEHAMNPAQYKTSQKVVQFLVEHQHCFKMPRSSWFTVLNQQQQDKDQRDENSVLQQEQPKDNEGEVSNKEQQQSNSTSSKLRNSPPPPSPAHRHHSQPHQHSNTTATNNLYNTNNNYSNISNQQQLHNQKSLDLSSTDSLFSNSATRPLSVVVSPNKEQRVKRAKTMPSRRSRYGPNDPLQIVQLNKSVIETTAHNK
jgi:hypothetical protein